jgi:hypothetical protein
MMLKQHFLLHKTKEDTGKLLAIDDLPVTILDQLAAAVGRSQLMATTRCTVIL